MYRDRRHAGRVLAAMLGHHRGTPNLLVLALPRGGVPVGYEIAGELDAPLDVFLVRKIGTPGQPELAMGAVGSGGIVVMNDPLLAELGLPKVALDAAVARAQEELAGRERLYRADRPPLEIAGKRIILVDDGLATGASMRAAITGLYRLEPERVIVAVPVSPPDTVELIASEVDEVVCPNRPAYFGGVGAWYEDFTQTSDEEVRELLARARGAEGPAAHP